MKYLSVGGGVMPTDKEVRITQKRFLTMLLEAEKNPAKLKEFIKAYSIEMDQEDVAFVKQEVDKEYD